MSRALPATKRCEPALMMQSAWLALAAGMALVLQNALMVAMTSRGLTLTGALFCNSLVGLVILSTMEWLRPGHGIFLSTDKLALWFVLPGLLGTFFVFASLNGYKIQGSAATIMLILTGQLISALILDRWGITGVVRELSWQRIVGTLIVMSGAWMVVTAP
ncbi:DMT family transporter [Pokkaliibacter sp. CJK22405]|uniref:DMT family transporter n=1 Tax=Pokkaliibacter sp. CJK22405 TaxID=3384615 RepID=UPI0039852D52